MDHPGIIVLVLGIIAGVIALAFLAERQRRREVEGWARERGWSFDPEKDRDLDDRYPDFKCLRRGHSRYANNILSGERNGLKLTAFDYRYVTGSGKNRRTHHFSAVVIRSPIPLKPLYIRREHLFDQVTEFFGMDDIDFESAEFSRRFYVKSPDKRWAYDVLHQSTMEYLLQAPEFNLQFDAAHVIAWRSRRFKGPDYDQACDTIQGILDRLPDYVRRQRSDGHAQVGSSARIES